MGIKGWAAGGLGFGLVLGFGSNGYGQGLYPQAPGANLEQLTGGMANALRGLVQGVANGGVNEAFAPNILRDGRELQQSTGNWYQTNQGVTDPYQLRRSYSGIDTSWHRLQGQLNQPAYANNPAIAAEIARVQQADAQFHQALNLNAYPTNLEGAGVAPAGLDETRRLAYSLAQRGEALASLIQSAYGNDPNAVIVTNDSAEIARMVDAFSDTLGGANGLPPFEQVQQQFAPIFQRSVGLGMNLDKGPMPPQLRSAWLSYATALNLVRDNLRLTNGSVYAQAQFNGNLNVPYNGNPAPQVSQWAETLDRQVDELIANFGPTAGVVPEGREMLGEMERLRGDIHNFREDAGRGLDPTRLAYEFREVDADWQRLARRFDRIARGRTGPNIQRVQQIGQTCEQIHQALGMPGYPPNFNQP